MSAPQDRESDLFGPPMAEFTGTLAMAPEVRMRAEHGRAVPVLCLRLHDVGPHLAAVHAELPFDEHERPAHEALARHLRAGQRVVVTSPLSALRLTLSQAISVAPVATTPSAD